ncbi:MAG: GAF domain-containing protein [Chitinophagaceae bacterium]|nr:MAG: GAF domain-containing protein [Chitinophagaceae bacterium]
MKKALLPLNEEVRLAELSAYRILDTPSEKEFDDLAELLRSITQCSGVAISFIDKDRQWFKVGIGIPVPETSRDIAMCSHTILEKDVMVVNDARQDERFHDNPFVTTGIKIRFYAGAPIVSANGHNIGTVCVFDPSLHNLTPEQKRSLEIISSQVTKLLELRLKNRIIMDKAEELIDIERKTLQLTLREQEKERQLIGFELHENFAQVLAACLMYLNMSAESKELQTSFVTKTQQELGKVLAEIRKMSKTYNPISLDVVSLEDIIRDYISEFQQNCDVKVRMDWKGSYDTMRPETAINFFRIIVQYISLVCSRKEVKNVVIRVNVKDELRLTIHSDGDPGKVDMDQQKIAINAILTRIDLCNGTYDLKVINSANTVFRVMLPLNGEPVLERELVYS